ncbi:hypothetical protein [Candidatus Uabimicrobium amorphum]|uniref:Uncharacterized protein n=1 Tax=Uabimicrobium amorphum TaxID=2596890 RepID=A0A5S9F670_UABAM|nr:hypothetical protein [Candidatus Uabimicrobium amorphum]BBM87368.1 hypothetical protein UABAM_05777 [Candidatus Uabimicrobium amorphum]
MKLKISDYFILLIFLLFTLGGGIAAFLEQGEKATELASIAIFFGLGFIFWLSTMIYKHRQQKLFNNNEADICLPIETPIAMSKSKTVMLALGIVIAGTATCHFTQDQDVPFACGIIMIAFGSLIFLATLTGLTANESFIFQPQGIRFVRRTYSFLVNWDNIDSYSSGEFYDNPAFIIGVSDMNSVLETVTASNPQKAKKKLAKRFKWDKMVFKQYAVMIMPSTYNINLADLHHTVAFCLEKYHNPDS